MEGFARTVMYGNNTPTSFGPMVSPSIGLYGLSQRPREEYPLYIQQFIPKLQQDGSLAPGDAEHMLHGALLYDLILLYQAQTVVEIGTREGKSARIIIEALRLTEGHLTSIDKDATASCREVSEEDQRKYLTRLTALDSLIEWTTPIQILFVDHSHDYSETRRTLAKFWPYITTPGAMLIADGDSHFDQGRAVQDFAETLHLGYIDDTRGQGYALFLKPSFPNQYRDNPHRYEDQTYHKFSANRWRGGEITVSLWSEKSCV